MQEGFSTQGFRSSDRPGMPNGKTAGRGSNARTIAVPLSPGCWDAATAPDPAVMARLQLQTAVTAPSVGSFVGGLGFFSQKMLLTKTRFDSQIAPISFKAHRSSTPVFAHSCCSALPWEGRCLFHSSTVIYNGVFGWRWSTYLSNSNRAVKSILLINSHQLNGKQ